MTTLIREKNHRLDKEFYFNSTQISFTVNIKNYDIVFTTIDIFRAFEDILINELKSFDCDAEVYVFMPTHLHLIVRRNEQFSDVLDFMKLFKQKTGFWFSQNLPKYKWQKDFYDHIIRDDEDIKNQIYYILNNPVRAGLVGHWKDYKFKGSTIYDLDEME